MISMLPVVLAGGSGTRLWPLSRELHPKQFLRLTGSRSLLQATLQRLQPLPAGPPCIVCHEEHRFLVAEHCREAAVRPGTILLECASRNTAPALALAACHARDGGADPLLLCVPADGHFDRDEVFHAAVLAGMEAARDGGLVAFGVAATRAHAGYGYIRAGPAAQGAREVVELVEKPDPATAGRYVASGEFLSNTGVYLVRASVLLRELDRYEPGIVEACERALAGGSADLDFFRAGRAFADAPALSLDRAVLERTRNAVVVPMDVDWSDVGSWPALHALAQADAAGNALQGDVVAVDTTNSLVRAADRLVATIGVDRLIVAETADAVLVADRGAAGRVGQLVARLGRSARPEQRAHRRVYRPWGHFDTVGAGAGYQVKRLSVKPGARLSLQLHRERSEHWVVVCGTAEVRCDDVVRTLVANQSTYIPRGSWHRLGNPGAAPLEIIEIQVGRYLGEDDIVRGDDDFGRGGSG